MLPSVGKSAGRRPLAAALIALSCLALGAALLAPLTTYPFGRDQGVFATIADTISQGGVPYRDAWDIKPPGVFYFFWLSFRAFGRSEAAPRLLDLLWTLATAVSIWALGRRLFSPWAGLAAAFLFLLRYMTHDYYWHTTQCDGFASLPLALAALALAIAEDRKSAPWAALCGALVGLAVIFKFTLGLFLALPVIALVSSQTETRGPRLARGACCLLGFAAVVLAAAGYLWKVGAWPDMVEVVFRWNAAYARLEVPGLRRQSVTVEIAKVLLGNPPRLLFPIGLLALAGLGDLCLRAGSARTRWLVPAWALAVTAQVWVQGRYYPYHWLPLLPPLALLAAQGLRAIGLWAGRSLPPRPARALSITGLALLVAILSTGYYDFLKFPLRRLTGAVPKEAYLRAFDRAVRSDFSLTADHEVAAWLKQHTANGDVIYIWGFEPLVYFLADRAPASRFIYNIPLVAPWSPPEWRTELISDLRARTPPYILVVHRDPQPWMVGRGDDSAAQLADFPELAQLLRERYRLAKQIQDFDVLELRPTSGRLPAATHSPM